MIVSHAVSLYLRFPLRRPAEPSPPRPASPSLEDGVVLVGDADGAAVHDSSMVLAKLFMIYLLVDAGILLPFLPVGGTGGRGLRTGLVESFKVLLEPLGQEGRTGYVP